MKKKTVYLVMGSSGEYDDFQEWPVVVYSNWSKADEHARRADKFDREWRKNNPKAFAEEYANPFDSTVTRSYYQNFYVVEEIEMLEEVPA